MKHTLKNRIISGFVALLLILTTTLPSGIVFGENEQADVLAVQEDTQATEETDANDDNEEGMQASDSQTGDDETEVGSSDDTSEGEKITGNVADSNAMDSDVNASGTDFEENNSQTNDSTENASNGKTSANDNNSETNIADDTELEHQNIEICPDETDPEKMVTLDGLMPKEAMAEVVDVTEQSETENVIAAYDITIVDGEEEYQPGEENPINVEITDPRITDGSNLQIWHITDDGEREEITDFTVEDGKVCFDAAGFSVYEIVEKTLTPLTGTGWFQIKTSDEFTAHAMDGIYISHTAGHFVSNVQYNISDARTGIRRTTSKVPGEPGLAVSMEQAAAPFYFELQQDGTYKIYCYTVENGQSVVKYVKQKTNSLSLVAEGEASKFSVEKRDGNNSNFVIAVPGTGTSRYCWNRQGGDNGSGFAAYEGPGDVNAQLNFFYYVPVPDDPYGLDGETYGLMNYVSGSDGNALMAEGATNSL
ncbi:MAG: hypothetical protein IJM25_00480, partial [Eubacterium sp.]|nr:hypothetical protein [Eubacterium sp.]